MGQASGMGQPVIKLAVDPSLAFFVRPRRRSGEVACDEVSSLAHVVESAGVPRTEVGALVVNGTPAAFGYRPRAGDVVQVLPVQRPESLDCARFVLDVHLGTVARRLRLVGLDAAYDRDASDDELVERANAEQRVLLTQDRGLLCRRALWRGAYVRGAGPAEQFADVLARFAPALAPWTRCPACNGLLAPVPKADVEPQLKPGTRRTYQAFARCRQCGQVYWHGAHGRRLDAIIESAGRAVAAASGELG
jgi:uncharacterized protein